MAALVALFIGFSKGGLAGTLGALATPLMVLDMSKVPALPIVTDYDDRLVSGGANGQPNALLASSHAACRYDVRCRTIHAEAFRREGVRLDNVGC